MMKKDKKKEKREYNNEIFCADPTINTDPNGSWTGVSTDNIMEKPIQDADDL